MNCLKLIIVTCTLILLGGCNPAPKVKLKVIEIVESPSKTAELVVVRQDPGALGPVSTAVFGRKPGNAKLENRLFVVKGECCVIVRWRSESSVTIVYKGSEDDVYTSQREWNTVKIEYRTSK